MKTENWKVILEKMSCLGENSPRKNFYPELQKKIYELEQMQNFFNSIFNNARDGISIYDKSGKLLMVNKMACQMFGIIPKTAHTHLITNFMVNPLNTNELAQLMENVLIGQNQVMEWNCRSLKNEIFLCEVSLYPTNWYGTDSFIAIFRDISDKKTTNELLRTNQDRLKLIVESVNEEFWDCNLITNDIYCSPALLSMLEMSQDEILSSISKIKNKIYEDDLPSIESLIKTLSNTKNDTFSIEYRINSHDGHFKWLRTRGKIVSRTDDGGTIRIVGVNTDISFQKEIEETLHINEHLFKNQNEALVKLNEELAESYQEIQKINVQLMATKEKAVESDQLKSAFLANMSHEIRTPMNGIVGFAHLLTEPGLSEEKINQYVEIINGGSKQLLTVIDDIIDISKIESGQLKISAGETHINELIIELYSLYATLKEESEVQFSFSVDLRDSEDVIIIDRIRLRQILNNLLSNAFKFTTSGEINFGYKVKDDILEFKVSDTGSGIAPEYHQLIFERFRQVETLSIPLTGGTGLGLSISKALVELMGGKIQVNSELNQGTTFTFSIPYLKKSYDNSPSLVQSKVIEKLNFENITLLVAEDEDINFMYMDELLSLSHITLIRARNGEEAVEMCKRHNDIKLVLMDIKMPRMDGYQATRLIKEFNKSIPIIALTAYAMTDDRNKAILAGCDDYITKPVIKKQLFHLLNIYLSPLTASSKLNMTND